MKKQIAIFTEATSTTGLGHFTRCVALAEVLSESGSEVVMHVISDDMPLPKASDGFQIVARDWRRNFALPAYNNENAETILFIDSYLAEKSVYMKLAETVSKLYCFDDFNRLLYPPPAKIINPGIGGNLIDYSAQAAAVMTGVEYILLRRPFREKFTIPKIRPNLQNMIVTLGAEDRWNITPQIMQLQPKFWHGIELHVIIGPGFMNKAEIRRLKTDGIHLYESLSAQEIQHLMIGSDLAITAAGQTTNELARCGVPMIILQVAENQRMNAHGWMRENIIAEYCDRAEDAVRFLITQVEKCRSVDSRQRMRLATPESITAGTGYTSLVA